MVIGHTESSVLYINIAFFLTANLSDKYSVIPKNFLSKKFFLDAELMILFYKSKMKMKSIHLRYRIYENSTIKIFDFTNFVYLTELFKLIFVYNIKKIKKLKI